MSSEIVASCSCGKVEFKSTENPVIQICCHCEDCREVTNTDYTTIVLFNSSAVTVSGKLSEYKFTAESGNQTVRESCSKCKTIMFDRSQGFPTLIGVISHQILEPFEAKPTHHIWVKSKLQHVSIPQGVKSFEKGIV